MNYSRLVRDRLARLDERPIPGFQSADDIFGRFISSTLNTKRFAERYEQVRRRVTEANELLRAELDLSLQLLIIFVAAGAAVMSVIDASWPKIGLGVWSVILEVWSFIPHTAAKPIVLGASLIVVVVAIAWRLSKKKRPPDRSDGRS